ncbi:hypothetical protein ACP6JE_001972 [Aspergillus fumigatus]
MSCEKSICPLDLEKNLVVQVENPTSGCFVTDYVTSHVVDWDGPDDFARPVNWHKKRKWLNVTSVAFLTFLTPLASSMVAPAGGLVIETFNITSESLASFVVSIYLVGFAVGPLVLGPLSEIYGRLRIYQACNAKKRSPNLVKGGAVFAFSLVFQTETYEPVLLQRRVDQLRKEAGDMTLRSTLAPNISARDNFIRSIARSLTERGIVYGYLYLLFTTITPVYQTTYQFSQGAAGLTYLGIGVGSLIGLLIFGTISDEILIYLTKQNDGVREPEFRMPPLIPGSLFVPIGLFWYGWSAEKQLHWMMPIVGTGFVGFGMLASFLPIQTYLVDAFSEHAASVTASMTVVRSLIGAFLPLAGPAMYARLGLGWGNSMLGFIALTMLPLPVVFYYYGKKIRTYPAFQVTF